MKFDFSGLTAAKDELPIVEKSPNHIIFRMGRKFIRLSQEGDKFYIRVNNPDYRYTDLLKVAPDIHSALKFLGYAGSIRTGNTTVSR